MNNWRLLPRTIGLVLVVLLVTACGTPQPTPTHTPQPPTPTPGPPTPTHTPLPPAPTATTIAAPTWDYVALGDSLVGEGWSASYAPLYAAHIEADLGIKVKLDNQGWPGRGSEQLLTILRTERKLRDAIGEAEIVTLVIGGNDIRRQFMGPYQSGQCGGEDNEDCLQTAIEAFQATYDAILAELFTLCRPGTIIRTMTLPYPHPAKYEWGIEGEPRPFLEPVNEHIIRASSENGIRVALVHLAFNGPDGTDDPADKGYYRSDGEHPNKAGAAAIADLHRELGYELTCP